MNTSAFPRLALGAIAAACAAAAHAQPLPMVAPAEAGFSSAGLERLDRFFAREIEARRVPGAVVAIARDGKLVHYKAYGVQDPATNRPMPLDAVFALASMTKIMTSVAALQLNEEGRLPLKSTLATYYPAFGTMKVGVVQPDGSVRQVDQARPIFIHDLFRHTAGLGYGPRGEHPVAKMWPAGTLLTGGEVDAAQFLDRITKLPLAHQPSTQFEYSYATDVLGLVVEKVSGQRLGEFMQARLWGPLKMTDTTFTLDKVRPRLARAFPNNPLDGRPQVINVIQQQVKMDCGGACAMGTVGDYVRFGQMLVNGGVLDGQRILSPRTVEHMTANHLGPDIRNTVDLVEPHRGHFGFGLGVSVRTSAGLSAVPGNPGEYSWNGAYGTQFFADPKDKLVVVVGTAAPGDLRKYYREQVQAIVYGAMTR